MQLNNKQKYQNLNDFLKIIIENTSYQQINKEIKNIKTQIQWIKKNLPISIQDNIIKTGKKKGEYNKECFLEYTSFFTPKINWLLLILEIKNLLKIHAICKNFYKKINPKKDYELAFFMRGEIEIFDLDIKKKMTILNEELANVMTQNKEITLQFLCNKNI